MLKLKHTKVTNFFSQWLFKFRKIWYLISTDTFYVKEVLVYKISTRGAKNFLCWWGYIQISEPSPEGDKKVVLVFSVLFLFSTRGQLKHCVHLRMYWNHWTMSKVIQGVVTPGWLGSQLNFLLFHKLYFVGRYCNTRILANSYHHNCFGYCASWNWG